jgi:6-phosphogluconolactonase (cycloisomerase 2 family)
MNHLVRYPSVLLLVVFLALGAFAAQKPHYVFTNDDLSGKRPNAATFFTVQANGNLKVKTTIIGGNEGIAGGYFGAKKLSVLQNGQEQCVFATASNSGQIAGFRVQKLDLAGVFDTGNNNDTGKTYGVGLAMNTKYLYASYTDSNNIGTYQVQSDCKLKFLSDVNAIGLQGGALDGMAITGNLLVVTYGDGSIQSFDISGGAPVSNDDEQNSTGDRGQNYPGGIDITQDGHYAIFGDVSTSTVVEVSDISSGKLSKTVAYHLGPQLSASSVLLSPDESLLYVANTQSGTVKAEFFDKTTGKITKGCTSPTLRGFGTAWAYLGTMVTETNSGTGNLIYVAEYGAPSSIGIVEVKVNGGKCTLQETAGSPASDSNSPGLLTIGSYPPRPF